MISNKNPRMFFLPGIGNYLHQHYVNYVKFWAGLFVSKREHHTATVQSELANRYYKFNQNSHALSRLDVLVIKDKQGTAEAEARYISEHNKIDTRSGGSTARVDTRNGGSKEEWKRGEK